VYTIHTMGFIRKIKRNGKTYLAEVENQRIRGKVVQKHIRYIGKEADGKTILSSSISDATVDKVRLHGPLMVLNHLAGEIQLSEMLGEYGEEILSLVYAHCLDYKSINQMSSWFENTDLNMILELNNLTEKKLLDALDSLEKKDSDKLHGEIFNKVKARYKLDTNGLVYDVTNTYFYGKKCPFGKYGKDNDGVKGRPLIQIGMAVTQKEGVPVFHSVYDGNTHDSRTFRDAITHLEDFNISESIFVFDRGISSEQIQKEIHQMNCKVLCGLPIVGGFRDIAKKHISEHNFFELGNRVKLNESVFYVITVPHKIGEICGTLAICFNEQKRKDLKESRYDEIVNAQGLLQKRKRIKEELEVFSKQGILNEKFLKEEETFDGYSFIFTTAEITKEQMVHLYFDKDLIEKAFQSIKGVTRLQPIRHWLYNRVKAHVFVCYLSYLLLSLLRLRVQKLRLSPVSALRELDSLYRVYIRDVKKNFKVSKLVALNKNQEKIIRAIDKKLCAQYVCSV
jgi:transposase